MQQTLPLVVCVSCWRWEGPADVIECSGAEPERGPLLAAGARVVPALQIHRHRTGKRNGTGQNAQLTKLNRLNRDFFRPNASFSDTYFIWRKWSKPKPRREVKKHGAAQRRKLLLTWPCAFSAVKISKVSWFVVTECAAEKKNSFLFCFTLWFPCWTHVKGTLLRRVCSNRFPTARGGESKWKCWRYAWNWWGVNLRKASRRHPAVIWKVRRSFSIFLFISDVNSLS